MDLEQDRPEAADSTVKATGGAVVAYVDGSYNHAIRRYAYGCVFLEDETVIESMCGSGDDPDCVKIRNVAGEMLGAMNAVKWARKHGYRELEIRHDYEGIEAWVSGRWRAKMPLTQSYARFMKEQMAVISITFTKVTAHSHDRYNDMADALAKSALEEISR